MRNLSLRLHKTKWNGSFRKETRSRGNKDMMDMSSTKPFISSFYKTTRSRRKKHNPSLNFNETSIPGKENKVTCILLF